MSSTAILAPSSISCPTPASGPVRGWIEPMTIWSGLESAATALVVGPAGRHAQGHRHRDAHDPASFFMSRAFRRRPHVATCRLFR